MDLQDCRFGLDDLQHFRHHHGGVRRDAAGGGKFQRHHQRQHTGERHRLVDAAIQHDADQIVLRGELSYPVPLGDDPRGNIVRLDNAIGNFADRIADADAALDSLEQQKQAAEVEIAKPFAQEEELQTKSARLAELDALLNMEHQSSRTEPEAEEKPDARPSVLAALEEKADKVEPVRPFKSYLDKDGDAR